MFWYNISRIVNKFVETCVELVWKLFIMRIKENLVFYKKKKGKIIIIIT